MEEHVNNLVFGLATAFLLPGICFLLGMAWSKAIGGWRDLKFRRWWTTFCLILPFVFMGMMTKRMAEDGFEGLREVWTTDPFQFMAVSVLALALSIVAVGVIIRVWHSSRPAND